MELFDLRRIKFVCPNNKGALYSVMQGVWLESTPLNLLSDRLYIKPEKKVGVQDFIKGFGLGKFRGSSLERPTVIRLKS